MARRAHLARRATEQGLPLTVDLPVSVADFSGGGLLSTTEQRTHSLFAYVASVVEPTLYAAVAQPLIDTAGEDIATDLVEAYGNGLGYPCTYGPAVVQQELEHPDLITTLTLAGQVPGDLASGMLSWEPIFYGLLLLRQCLLEYLATIPSLGIDDPSLAERLADDLVRFAASNEMTCLARVPLAGLDIDGDLVEVEGCTLRRLGREEVGYLSSRRTSLLMFPFSRVASGLPGLFPTEFGLQERIALEVRVRQAKTTPFSTAALPCQKLLTALHLIGLDFAGAGFGAMLQEPRWAFWFSGQSGYPLLMPRHNPASLTVVGEPELRAALSVAARIPDGAVHSPTSSAELSIRRLGLAMSRTEPTEAIVDYTVALEALFLGSTEIGEATRRFALNGAAFAGKTMVERQRLYQELRDIYRSRSILVHGVNPRDKQAKRVWANAGSIRDQAREIARTSVRKALEFGWPTEETFLDALLDDAPIADARDTLG